VSELEGPRPRSPLVELAARVREPGLPVLVVAHRGDSQNAPENTLGAMALAIESQANLIEFDVLETADGDVVVMHDDKVDRTTNGKGEVHKMRTEELRELSAGEWFASAFKDEKIPFLDEVLDLCKGHVLPMIEIKAKAKRAPDLGAKVAAALRRHNMTHQAVVICKELARVQEVHSAIPETPIAYLTFTKRQALNSRRVKGVCGVDPYWKSLSLSLVETLHDSSFFLTPWTVNRARDIDRLLLLGCQAIISDAPVSLRDRIEGFEFERTWELHERFVQSDHEFDMDLEIEVELDDLPAPEEVARLEATDSELDLDLDWPEDPPE
jgi:glycerophosphoryl diester phosphodiesterase